LRAGCITFLAALYNHFTAYGNLKSHLCAVEFRDGLGFFTLQGFCKLLILLTPF